MDLREEVALSKGESLLLSSSLYVSDQNEHQNVDIGMFFFNIIQFIVHVIWLIAILILIVLVIEFEWFDWCISVYYCVLIDKFVIMIS